MDHGSVRQRLCALPRARRTRLRERRFGLAGLRAGRRSGNLGGRGDRRLGILRSGRRRTSGLLRNSLKSTCRRLLRVGVAVKQPQATPEGDRQYDDRYDRQRERARFTRLAWKDGLRRRFANDRLRNRSCGRWWRAFERGFQVGGRRTVGGVLTQTSTYGGHECWRKSRGQPRGFGSLVRPRRKALGEGLDQCCAKTPDIAGRRKPAVNCFRRIVEGRLSGACPRFAGGTDRITCQFQLIVDHQEVWRLQVTLHQVLAVKESQGVEGGKQHFPHFVGSQGPVG